MAKQYSGWKSISAGMSIEEAVRDARRNGQSPEEYGREVETHWEDMFPGEEMPYDLAEGIARDIRAAEEHGVSDEATQDERHEQFMESRHKLGIYTDPERKEIEVMQAAKDRKGLRFRRGRRRIDFPVDHET